MITADELTKIVHQFPSPDDKGILSGADRDAMLQAVNAILAHGRDGLVALIDLLKGPAQGGDTRAHHLLNAVAVAVSAQDTEQRRAVASAIASTLTDDRPTEVQAFLIRQLQVASGAEVIPMLGPLLGNPDLCEPATQALLAIGSDSAETFRNALPQAPEACRLTIAQALGVLGDAPSTEALLHLLEGTELDLRLAAAAGLARIGAPPRSLPCSRRPSKRPATSGSRPHNPVCCWPRIWRPPVIRKMPERSTRPCRKRGTVRPNEYVHRAASIGLAALGAADNQDGWKVLLDGTDLSAWQNARGGPPGKGWIMEDGAVVRKEQSGDIWTKERFGDFVLDLEFKTEGNSGVFIRTDQPTDNVQTGIEIQVYKSTDQLSTHCCGAVYDCLAPSENAVRDNEWNRMVITAEDNKLLVEMNGRQIIDMDLNQWTVPQKNPDGSKNKFRTAIKDFKREGHIGLQDHGAVVAYRNMRIQEK